MSQPPFRILFAVYTGMTQLDFTGPHQFLSRIPGSRTFVAISIGGAVASEGLVFADACRLSDVSGCDLLCVPGGLNALDAALDNTFIGEIRRLGGGARYVTSVCTGSSFLEQQVCCTASGRPATGRGVICCRCLVPSRTKNAW